MWTALPLLNLAAKLAGRRTPADLQTLAEKTWELAPPETATVPPALFLPGQLDRVMAWAFDEEHPRRPMAGDFQAVHGPTRAFLLRDVWLVDGVLYKDRACRHLQPRASRWPRLGVEEEIERAALYCTFGGNKYFGTWLMDDCATHALAAAEGVPLTTERPLGWHEAGYEAWLGMSPRRTRGAFLREVVLFDDVGQNRNKRGRWMAMGAQLRTHVEVRPHPGVFIVRGTAGQRRVLKGELELAERLRERHGFKILDPSTADVPTIVRACAGARMIVGVEGSALIHGVLQLPPGGGVLTLQPPTRFCWLVKHLTDRDDQHFGFVVGTPDGADFRVDLEEVERTLALFPAVP